MGQKVNPNGFRIGINKDWQSKWYAKKRDYAIWLHSDIKIRKAIFKDWKHAAISKIEIERSKGNKDTVRIKVRIHSARPGILIGAEGANLKVIEAKTRKALGLKPKDALNIEFQIVEIKNPNLDAQLVADMIALQIVNRASFRTVQKKAILHTMKAGAKGIKTLLSGRLGGVEMARTEGYSEGSVPLSTIRNDIDYAKAEALTTYGLIGVKVWIYHDEILPTKKNVKEAR